MQKLKAVLSKYKSIPIQARASFWFLICGILQNGLNVITLPLFTRLLTTEQYGLSSTYFAWSDLIVIVCTLRLSYGVFDKGMIKYTEERDKFESAILGLTTTIAVSMLGLFLLFHDFVEKALGMSFVLCFSLFSIQIFAPALLFWTARNKYEYKYRKFTIVTICTSVICTVGNLLAVLTVNYDRGVTKILSYQIIWCAVYVVFYIYIFAKGKTFFRKDIWKYALGFNLPLIPYFLSTLILDKADRIMIGYFCGNSDVALYSVSYNLGRLMVLLTSAIDSTFTPWIYQKLKNKDIKNGKKVTFGIMLAFMALASMFMLFAPELIGIFAAEQYKSAVYIIPPVAASYFFVMMYNIISKVEFYYEKTKAIAFVTAAAAVLDIVLNYFAIPRFGYIAAGYTTLISYIFMAAGHFVLSWRISKKNNINKDIFPWKSLCLLSLLMIAVTVSVNLLYSNTLLRWCALAAIVAVLIVFRRKLADLIKTIGKKESISEGEN